MSITIGTLLVIGVSLVLGGGLAVNEVQNHTIGNALKESTNFAYNTFFAITEWNVLFWKHLFEGEVTDNDLSAVTDELELTPLAEQARLALNLSTKNVHGMVDFSMWKLKLPSDSVIIDYPVDIPKNNGVIIFPKPQTVKPKVEGVPVTPQTPTIIIEYPPKVPDFTGFESFPAITGDKDDIIMSVEGGTNTSYYNWGNKATLDDHYTRHGEEVAAQNIQDYTKKANDFYNNRSKYQVKVDKNGVTRVYDATNNLFGSYNKDGSTRTFYSPKRGQNYFNDQPGKLIN